MSTALQPMQSQKKYNLRTRFPAFLKPLQSSSLLGVALQSKKRVKVEFKCEELHALLWQHLK